MFVVDEHTFLGVKPPTVEGAAIDFGFGLEQMLLARQHSAVQQAEYFAIVAHGFVHLARPVAQSVEAVAAPAQFGKQLPHSGHFARHHLLKAFVEGVEQFGARRMLLLQRSHLQGKRCEFAVEVGIGLLGEHHLHEFGEHRLAHPILGAEQGKEPIEIVVDKHASKVEEYCGDFCHNVVNSVMKSGIVAVLPLDGCLFCCQRAFQRRLRKLAR